MNFVVRELVDCGGEQVSPFSYSIKGGDVMILEVKNDSVGGEVYEWALCHLRI